MMFVCMYMYVFNNHFQVHIVEHDCFILKCIGGKIVLLVINFNYRDHVLTRYYTSTCLMV